MSNLAFDNHNAIRREASERSNEICRILYTYHNFFPGYEVRHAIEVQCREDILAERAGE